MNASLHQVYGKRGGGEKAGLVLRMGGEPSPSVARPLTRLFWREEGRSLEAPHLTSFAWERRTELTALARAEATAGLRELFIQVTRLASVRPVSPRLKAAPPVSAQGFSPAGPSGSAWVESGHDPMVEEGGIYSW